MAAGLRAVGAGGAGGPAVAAGTGGPAACVCAGGLRGGFGADGRPRFTCRKSRASPLTGMPDASTCAVEDVSGRSSGDGRRARDHGAWRRQDGHCAR